MKQKILTLMLFAFALSLQTPTFAQKNGTAKVENKAGARFNSEKFIERQTNYVAAQIMTDDSNREAFKTLYKKYLADVKNCERQWRDKNKEMTKGNCTNLTDAQIEERIEGRFAHMHKILDIREKYYNEFKKILKPRQIQKMYKAEKDIKKKVRNEMKRRHNNVKRR